MVVPQRTGEETRGFAVVFPMFHACDRMELGKEIEEDDRARSYVPIIWQLSLEPIQSARYLTSLCDRVNGI